MLKSPMRVGLIDDTFRNDYWSYVVCARTVDGALRGSKGGSSAAAFVREAEGFISGIDPGAFKIPVITEVLTRG